ncbi:MAG: outer membrane lipoprotein chaperone LolA [Cellvibrio sp.]|uniref:outer membrane lipoprotein chaperone LolA n=1 Tax=Cellvibrio sp. TaxID=1965322 RepID=UPI00271FAD4D|nr:outer membrane lipoprotein chaperone LolA [Cellvibrio sp.]
MKLFSRIFTGLLMAVSVVVTAADDQAAAQLRKQLDAMNTLQGDFVQTTYDKKGVEQETSSGNFMLMRPGKFYWKTLEPMQQLLVSNNKTIWLYDPDLETVNERAFTDDLRETPALLLSSDIEQLRKSFTVTRDEKDTSAEKYTLTPKVTDGMFQHLTLVFKANQLTEFAIQDSLGQLTRCVLTNVQRNKTLPEEKFFFIPPEGVEILKD